MKKGAHRAPFRLAMEAVWKIEVVDFPAFILVDDKGHDFFRELPGGCGICGP